LRAVVAREPGGPEVLGVEDVPAPALGAGEALIRVAYASFNPLDTHARAARVEYKASAFPYTPGYEYAGRVEKVGAGVDAGLVGRRVSFVGHPGGCAEYALAPLRSPLTRLFEIPDAFDWQLGTVFAVCAYSAWHILHTAAHVRAGETVLFHGAAGSIGTMGTQIAKEAGATVLGLCGGAEKLAWARPFGADQLIDHTNVDWVDETRRLTGGRGVDVIVDGVAGPAAPRNFEALARFGQVVYIGRIGGGAPPVDVSRDLYAKSIAVRAFLLYVALDKTGGRELPAIHEALASGRWRIPIGRVWELEEVAELHRRFEQRALLGKQLVRVGGDL
jgi:NADPH2:quinone reductase